MSKKNPQTPDTGNDLDLGEVYTRTELFLDKHKKRISIVAGALVALVALFFGYRKLYAEPRAQEAAELIWKAEYWFEIDSLDRAMNGDEMWPGFAVIAEDYGDTPSGKLAHYYLGTILMKKEDWNGAIEHYRKAKLGDDVLRVMAVGNIGDALVELGRPEEAVKQFEKAAGMVTNDFTTPMYLLKAGILHQQAGNWKAARKAFERIVKEFPNSSDVSQARKYAGYAEAMGG
jgi:tetratricopeptide (TPR) repeat protein